MIQNSTIDKLSTYLSLIVGCKNYYAKQDGGSQLSYDSLKQFIMMQDYNADTWNELDIFDHQKKMIDLWYKFSIENWRFVLTPRAG